MKNILLLVHDDAGQEARLQTALDITRALEGHLSCIDVAVVPLVAADINGGAEQAMLLEEERDRERANRATLEARLNREAVSWDWTDVIGGMAQAMVDASSLADIIILNRQLEESSFLDMREITSRVVMKSRAPVAAVPEDQTHFGTDRALVAWDGSESCAATLRACVPLLKLASDVRIFTATEKSNQLSPAAAAQYLSRHGIRAEIDLVERGSRNADDLIAEAAASAQADYVLMGAYGRGRLRETFGGVTKRLLSSSKLPLILGH
ncbi:universal stress protein [Sphingobium jiangsuense]|uniref:Nucleotide-binding universal stress UspA family protein n=1 Tax=Sphingobium jiangsuense TaxID=870476 RepID=A0A7W6BNK6_9SPHN|nr:universal stress protein [Sphingobium jiangsuense]MBB3928442.1 nucleotide-binding universal stress UspA family protein [Sphingobium jiangsuense]GLT02480.1 universal stress protein [Sphingobium jiangsuense]